MVWSQLNLDLSYAFVVATVGVREVLIGFDRHDTAQLTLAWAIGLPAALWTAGIVVAHMTGWGWLDRESGIIGVAISAAIACCAVSIRAIIGASPR